MLRGILPTVGWVFLYPLAVKKITPQTCLQAIQWAQLWFLFPSDSWLYEVDNKLTRM